MQQLKPGIFNSNYWETVTIPGYYYSTSGSCGSSTEFLFSVGEGYEIPVSPKNAVDFTWIFNVTSNLNFIGERAAYRFNVNRKSNFTFQRGCTSCSFFKSDNSN